MAGGEFSRFFAWAATFALLASGASMFIFGIPFLICGVVGLVYLTRRPPRWPGALGAGAGIGAVMVLWGTALSATAGYAAEGAGVIGAGAVFAIMALLVFRREVGKGPVAGDRRGRSPTDGDHGGKSRSSKAIRRFPIWLALGLFLVPSSLFWVYGSSGNFSSLGEFACYEAFLDSDQGADITDEPSLWPPGGKCVYHGANGTLSVRSKDAPWPAWVACALLGLCAGIGAWVYITILRAAEPA